VKPSLRRTLAGSAAVAAGLALAAPAHAQTTFPNIPGVVIPENPCAINYFAQSDSWEIDWGGAYYEQRQSFDADSYGGLVDVNGGGVPDYITNYVPTRNAPAWRWWYISREALEAPGGARLDLTFEDGTRWRGEAEPDVNGCPSVMWTPNPSSEPAPDPEPGTGTGSLGSVTFLPGLGSTYDVGSAGGQPGLSSLGAGETTP
jgi:hypothetical protein